MNSKKRFYSLKELCNRRKKIKSSTILLLRYWTHIPQKRNSLKRVSLAQFLDFTTEILKSKEIFWRRRLNSERKISKNAPLVLRDSHPLKPKPVEVLKEKKCQFMIDSMKNLSNLSDQELKAQLNWTTIIDQPLEIVRWISPELPPAFLKRRDSTAPRNSQTPIPRKWKPLLMTDSTVKCRRKKSEWVSYSIGSTKNRVSLLNLNWIRKPLLPHNQWEIWKEIKRPEALITIAISWTLLKIQHLTDNLKRFWASEIDSFCYEWVICAQADWVCVCVCVCVYVCKD